MRLRRYPQGVQHHQLRPIWPRHLQQRRRAGNCRDALLHLSARSRRRIRPAPVKPTQAADRQYQGERRSYCSHGTRSISKRKSIICELLFPSSILAVKMNRKTLVIVLETEIYTYDISNMRLLHVIETTPNPEGEFTRYIRRAYRINYRFYSRLRAFSLGGQFISCLSIASPIAIHLTRSSIFGTITTLHIRAPEWRRPHLLNPVTDRRQCHPSTQSTHLLPLHQLHRYAPRHGLGEGHRHPRLEHTRC
jgi:hypothetical protein